MCARGAYPGLDTAMARSRLLWKIVQVISLPAIPYFFVAWIPWWVSQPIAAAPPDVVSQMPPGCPAVQSTTHGIYSCFWAGPLRDHPTHFALLTVGLLASWALVLVPSLMDWGFSFGRTSEDS